MSLTSLKSQTGNIKMSDPLDTQEGKAKVKSEGTTGKGLSKNMSSLDIIGVVNGNTYSVTTDNDQLVLNIHSKSMELVQQKVLNFNLDKKRYLLASNFRGRTLAETKVNIVTNYYISGNYINFFIESIAKKNGFYELLMVRTDLKLTEDPKVYTLIKSKEQTDNKPGVEAYGDGYTFKVKQSPDSTKNLICFIISHTITFKVYDKNFENVLTGKDVEINKESWFLRLLTFDIDNLGNAYTLVKIAEKTGKEWFELTSFQKETGSPQNFELSIPEKHIRSIDMKCFNDNTIFLTGFYNKRGKKSDGYFNYIFDCKSQAIANQNISEPVGLYDENSDDGILQVKNIFNSNDGYYVVGEQLEEIVDKFPTYNYGDIVCLKLDNKGGVIKVNKVNKRQWEIPAPSVCSLLNNDAIYLLFVDLDKNINTKDIKEYKSIFGKIPKEVSLQEAVVNFKDIPKKTVIQSLQNTEKDLYPRPMDSRGNNNTFIINFKKQLGLLQVK